MPDSTREEERQESLDALWKGDFQLDVHFGLNSFGRHELVDRLSMLSETFEAYVLEHPSCIMEKGWYDEADDILGRLWGLYQKVAASE